MVVEGMLGASVPESRIREVVADLLGLRAEDLSTDVSLTDDLAADSLDLAELTISLEEEFDVGLGEAALDDVRTYGDLVTTVLNAIRRQRAAAAPEPLAPVAVRIRVAPPGGRGQGLVHTGPLTPYLIENVMDEALRAGPGAAVEVMLPAATGEADRIRVSRHFAKLERRGIQVSLQRDGHATALPGTARTGR